LVDTGSNKNYVCKQYILSPQPNDKPFLANSIGGPIRITHHSIFNIFNNSFPKQKYFIVDSLDPFDVLLGNDTLTDFDAVIHVRKNFMTINEQNIKLKRQYSQAVNNIRIEHLNENDKEKIELLTKRYSGLFAEPDEKLTFTTNVIAEINTTSENPVYTSPYPYPMALKPVVDEEIRTMLENGVIRPSRSPYNSPIIVVPKKMDASGKPKHRLVYDYKKLNAITKADRYPIPDINELLANLGKNQFFSTIDLKSGFHQILLKESDKEKTAFSVNNGKFEFNRLPFGLKNAPAIFQRALDDILRDHIGVRCYVYIDDIVIFAKTKEEHFQNLEIVFRTLLDANLKVQVDKCEFLKEELEFLGFIVSKDGLKTNPKKVKAIAHYPVPTNLKELRSFLGLSGYYRRFIRDYAKIAKPLTNLLRGEEGRISKSQSKKKPITLDENALEAFNKLRNTLVSNEVMLAFPDFEKDFQLTTDASNFALGAVLAQNDKPITFLSRSLNKTEESYAANEKEMLAIIWALGSLRNYLYGSKKVIIHTDHQPLTYALSNKNTNSKLKRWKSILEEYNYELKYMPGKSNIVADALSRIQATNINSLTPTMHSDESSSHNLIPCVEIPINVFKNQVILKIGSENSHDVQHPFENYTRHIYTQQSYSEQNLIDIFKQVMQPKVVNGLSAPERVMGLIQTIYPRHFESYKIRYTQTLVEDVVSEPRQDEIIVDTHNRAHRCPKENRLQIMERYYFPGMHKKIKRIAKLCEICKHSKYDRKPTTTNINETPIPTFPGHTVHIDIFSTEGQKVLTAVDKFSKFAIAKPIKSKAVEDIRQPLREILFFFGVPRRIVIDNEAAFNSVSILFMMRDELKIEVFTTPAYKSEINGQVERFHSTLAEIMRCLKADGTSRNFQELLERAVNEYNHTFHSTINAKPVNIYFGRHNSSDPEDYERTRLKNINNLTQKQIQDLEYHNQNRQAPKNYNPGDIIFVKKHKRKCTKLSQKYSKEIVRENKHSVVITESGKTVHKDHIKN